MSSEDSPSLTIGPASGDHLEFKLLEIEPPDDDGFTYFSAAISVSCGGFRAPERACLFLRDMFDDFLVALRGFEASRVGRATLESLPSSGFTLTIASDRPTKWPVVSGMVTGNLLDESCDYSGRLTFAFPLDSSFIVQVLEEFAQIMNHAQGSARE